MFDSHGIAYQQVWKPARGERRLELVDLGPRIVVPEEGDWRRWRRLAKRADVDAIVGSETLRCMGMFAAHPSGFAPEAVGNQRLAYLLTTAILKLNPAATYITIATGVSNWANSGTASTSLDVAQVTGSRQPAWGAATGATGGPGLTFTAASLQWLRSGAYTWNQPSAYVVRFKRVSHASVNMNVIDAAASFNTRRIYCNSTIDPTTAVAYAGALTQTTASVVSDNVWVAVGATYNGASSLIYAGGVATTGNTGTAAADGITVGNLGVGTNSYFDGVIDWVLGWNYALTAADHALVQSWLALR